MLFLRESSTEVDLINKLDTNENFKLSYEKKISLGFQNQPFKKLYLALAYYCELKKESYSFRTSSIGDSDTEKEDRKDKSYVCLIRKKEFMEFLEAQKEVSLLKIYDNQINRYPQIKHTDHMVKLFLTKTKRKDLRKELIGFKTQQGIENTWRIRVIT